MRIIYFYSEVMGYTLAVIRELVKTYNAEIHVVYWDHKRKSAYELPILDGVTYYKRSENGSQQLKELIDRIQPDLLYVSGRMDADYLKATLYARKMSIKTVSGFDNQWKASLKNYIVSFLSAFLYKKYFDYIWVAGVYQYEYARRLGYSKNKIIWNVYSADTKLFEKIYDKINIQPDLCKRFVFVGRFADVKGINILTNAFIESKKTQNHDWKLVLIGNGPLYGSIPKHADIEISDFLQPDVLAEKTAEGGVFVLPSTHEAWGVVLHEFAVAGFPIICSDACGAATAFVKHGYNGYVFKSSDAVKLQNAMLKMINSSHENLKLMSKRSNEISKYINPAISAASFAAVLDN